MTTPTPAPKTMDTVLRRYATQATIASSLVVGVTGVMLFFHLAEAQVKEMHEWLGMAFVVVAALHAVRHRQIFVSMLSQPRMRVLALITALAAAAFVVVPSEKGPNPFRQATQVVMKAPLKDLAPVVGVSAQDLTARLNAAGYPVTDTTLSIEAIARGQGTDPIEVMLATLKN